MTHVLCAYVDLHPETERALRKYVPAQLLSLVDVSGRDNGYYEEIAKRWTGKESLIVVEHDIEIQVDTVSSFNQCFDSWCSFGYELRTVNGDARLVSSLGCTKFSAQLQQQVSIAEFKGYWKTLDQEFMKALWAVKAEAHVHGYVRHHHYRPCRKTDCVLCPARRPQNQI